MHECCGCRQCTDRDEAIARKLKNAPSVFSLKIEKIKDFFKKKENYIIANKDSVFYIYLNRKIVKVMNDKGTLEQAMQYVRANSKCKKFKLKVI